MKDSELDELLRNADAEISVTPGFRQGVWHRIESGAIDDRKLMAWIQYAFALLARPTGAMATVAAVGVLGLVLGATDISDPEDSKLSYVESVSPFAGGHGQ